MKPGKKLIRNTVFGLWGAAALFVGLNRLDATPAGAEERGSHLTLGLVRNREPEANPDIDLASARDFTRLSVRGRLNVEVVGAADWKVTLTPVAGQSPEVHAHIREGVLHIDGGDPEGAVAGVLRLEVPTLQRIDVTAPHITIQGLAAPEVRLSVHRVGGALLQQNQVKQWQVYSSDGLDLRVDDATFSSGTITSKGDVILRRAP